MCRATRANELPPQLATCTATRWAATRQADQTERQECIEMRSTRWCCFELPLEAYKTHAKIVRPRHREKRPGEVSVHSQQWTQQRLCGNGTGRGRVRSLQLAATLRTTLPAGCWRGGIWHTPDFSML